MAQQQQQQQPQSPSLAPQTPIINQGLPIAPQVPIVPIQQGPALPQHIVVQPLAPQPLQPPQVLQQSTTPPQRGRGRGRGGRGGRGRGRGGTPPAQQPQQMLALTPPPGPGLTAHIPSASKSAKGSASKQSSAKRQSIRSKRSSQTWGPLNLTGSTAKVHNEKREENPVLKLPSLKEIRRHNLQYPLEKIEDLAQRNQLFPQMTEMKGEDAKQLEEERHKLYHRQTTLVQNISTHSGVEVPVVEQILTPTFLQFFGNRSSRIQLMREIENDLRNEPQMMRHLERSNNFFNVLVSPDPKFVHDPRAHAAVLSTLLKVYHDFNRLANLRHMVTGALNIAKRDSSNDPTLYENAALKQNVHNTYLYRAFSDVIHADPQERIDLGIGVDVPILKEMRRKVVGYDDARKNNLISEYDYQQATSQMWEAYQSIFTNPKIGNSVRTMVESDRQKEMKKSALEMNALRQTMAYIDDEAAHLPDSASTAFVKALNKNIKDKLRTGNMSPTEAFERLNTLQHMTKQGIETGVFPKHLRTSNTQRTDEHVWQTNPQRDNPAWYQYVRDDGLWAFPNIDFAPQSQSGIRGKIVRNVYQLDPYTKQGLHDDIQRLTATLPILVDKNQIDGLDEAKTNEMVMRLQQELLGSNILQHLRFKSPKGAPERYNFFTWMSENPKLLNNRLTDARNPNRTAQAKQDLKAFADFLTKADPWLGTNKMNDPDAERDLVKRFKATHFPRIKGDPENIDILDPMAPIKLKPNEPVNRTHVTTQGDTRKMENQQKMFTYDHTRYGAKPTKDYAESQKTEYKDQSIEYVVKTEEDLARMRSEVGRMEGTLYIIDFRTGRMYPIALKDCFIGAVYVFKQGKGELTETFATGVVKDVIKEHEKDLLPYVFMRDGNDKIKNLWHRLPTKKHSTDYRAQMRNERGAGLWSFVKKKLSNVGEDLAKGASKAVSAIGSGSVKEFNNFKTQEVRNARNIYQSSSNLVRHPSWSSFGNAALGVGKFALQPIVSGARETALVSDATNKIPGLNMVKYGTEWLIPPLGIVDALSHAVKNSGYGSQDPANYLKSVINLGDALIGSGTMSGAVDAGARVLNTTGKIVDAVKSG